VKVEGATQNGAPTAERKGAAKMKRVFCPDSHATDEDDGWYEVIASLINVNNRSAYNFAEYFQAAMQSTLVAVATEIKGPESGSAGLGPPPLPGSRRSG
jgi:hypothetical protein